MSFAAGMRIGRYELKHQLGEGGFGVVFVARDLQLERDCAIKFLHVQHTQNRDLMQRFLNEARIAAKIDHPGIVTVFECGQVEGTGSPVDGSAFIAMELLKGHALVARLERSAALKPALAIEIARQIASALAAAHRVGVIHRDLKPHNVFLVPDRASMMGERVKVLDFGIAKLGEASAQGSDATGASLVFGTPRYMSPEQCRSSANVDHRTDIYALGVMLFEMLCGKRPFDGQPGELISMHQVAPAPTVRSLRPELEGPIDVLVAQMLAKAPAERIASMEEVVRQLDKISPPAAAAAEAAAASTLPHGSGSALADPLASTAASAVPAPNPMSPEWLAPTVAPKATPSAESAAPAPDPMAKEWLAPTVAPKSTPSALELTAASSALASESTAAPAPSVLASGPVVAAADTPQTAHTSSRSRALWALAALPLVGGGLYFALGSRTEKHPVPAPSRDAAVPPADAEQAPSPPPGMVYVPPATFTLGSSDAEIDSTITWCKTVAKDCRSETFAREKPAQHVTLPGFFLDRTERTNADVAQWLKAEKLAVKDGMVSGSAGELVQVQTPEYADQRPLRWTGKDLVVQAPELPATYITHDGAAAFCAAKGLRLPSEAEWERAARGADGFRFPWGNDDPRCTDAVFGRAKGGPCAGDGKGLAPAVTELRDITHEGVVGLAGNAAEWVADRFAPYGTQPPAAGDFVIRGGYADGVAVELRAAGRAHQPGTLPIGNVGFRCATSLPKATP